jgi:hypothetical protein
MTLDRVLENIFNSLSAELLIQVMPAHAGASVEENGKQADRLFSAIYPQILSKRSARPPQGTGDRKIRAKRSAT